MFLGLERIEVTVSGDFVASGVIRHNGTELRTLTKLTSEEMDLVLKIQTSLNDRLRGLFSSTIVQTHQEHRYR